MLKTVSIEKNQANTSSIEQARHATVMRNLKRLPTPQNIHTKDRADGLKDF